MDCKKMDIATYQKEKAGNNYCGDRYFFKERSDDFICVIVDGLGSGKIAGESSQAVINIIQNNVSISDEDLIKECAKKLAGKRGVVLGVLRIDFNKRKYTYSSIGNVSLVITTNNRKRNRTIPRPGFLGSYERQLKVVQGELEKNMGFLMFSDGISDHELSRICLFNENVDEIIQTFPHINNDLREDDTTLIAMRYNEKDVETDS